MAKNGNKKPNARYISYIDFVIDLATNEINYSLKPQSDRAWQIFAIIIAVITMAASIMVAIPTITAQLNPQPMNIALSTSDSNISDTNVSLLLKGNITSSPPNVLSLLPVIYTAIIILLMGWFGAKLSSPHEKNVEKIQALNKVVQKGTQLKYLIKTQTITNNDATLRIFTFDAAAKEEFNNYPNLKEKLCDSILKLK